MSVKKLLKGLKKGLLQGLKKIPARIYILLIVSAITIAGQVILYQPFIEMADSSFQYYAEYERHLTHKSQDEELLEQLMQKNQQVRDKYLTVDLTAETNIIEKVEQSLVSSFATVGSVVGQGLIFIALSIPYFLLFKLAIVKPIANYFNPAKRAERKALKAGNKVKLLEAKKEKKASNKKNSNNKKVATKKARHA